MLRSHHPRHKNAYAKACLGTSWLNFVLFVGVLICAFAAQAQAEPNYPSLTGRIVDQVGLLSSADRAQIETELAKLEGTSTDQLAIVIVNSLDGYSIEDYAIGLARKWGIGQKDKDNGVVLLVAPTERKVRIEVGRRLEPMLTDTMSKLIIQNAILPGFRRGDFAGGIRAGVRDIKDVLLGDAEAVAKRARGRNQNNITTEEMIMLAIWLAIFAYIIWQQYQQAKRRGPHAKRRRRHLDDGSVIIIPGGHSDHWDGGWSGGGGGWSGGGGSFGGGGASGSW